MRDSFESCSSRAKPRIRHYWQSGSRLRRTVQSALLTAAATALLGASAAQAQQAAADQGAAQPALTEVVITGSRIPVPANINSTSPIQAITSQDISLSGRTDIGNVMNTLPQLTLNASVDLGNNSNPLTAPGGIATADLRGLGPQRTLVLVDGRRLGVGDASTSNPNPSPDLDQIPAALVERIDVVTGGASAVYGSDAMAGVVNFIMRKNFQGVEIDGEYGFFQHSNHETSIQNQESLVGVTPPTGSVQDGDHRDLTVIMGTNIADGAGNLTAYFSYHNQSPVADSSRDFGDCLLATATVSSYACANSSNSNRFTVQGATARYTVVGNQLLPWPQAGSNPPATFNSNAYEYLQRQDERYLAGAFAHLDLNDAIKPYMEFTFMNDRTTEVTGPSALFTNGDPYTPNGNYLINCTNPLLSAQEQSILCTPAQIAADKANPGSPAGSTAVTIGRRNVEGGGRIAYYEHINYRIVAGLTGDLGDAWKYDAYGQYYYTSFYNANQNYLNYASVNNALQVIGTAANPQCISGSPCVPYNIFTTGAVTPAQLNYLYTPGTAYGTNEEEIQHADFTGDLGKYGAISPWAKDGVAVNIGAEHRFEGVNFQPDGTEILGNLAGFSGAVKPIVAGYSVKEAFVEGRAPLVQGMPGVYDLSVDAGYRYSDYSTSAGRTNTYKFEIQYAPIQDFRLRYSFDRAVRAPNLIDLYNPQSYGQQTFQGTDPCAPTTTSTGALVAAKATLAQCMRTGVTAAEYGNGSTTDGITQCVAGQCGEVIGGNTQLQAETADTYSLGLSLTPTFAPDFNATIDYWHIALSNVIGSIPANIFFNGCLNGTVPAYCTQILRTPGGSLTGATVQGGGYIFQTSVNTAAELVSGIDVQANYTYRLPGAWGSVAAVLNGSYLQKDTSTPYPGAHTYDCAGLFGSTCNNGVNPRWRHNLRVNWVSPWKVILSAQWRYIGASSFDNNSSDPTLHYIEEGAYDVINARIPGYSYLDLSASWNVWSWLQLYAGTNNVFDKDPPVIPSGDPITPVGTPNTYPTYDEMGREVFIAFKAKF